MRLNILGLEAFIAIADRGGFQAAASYMNLSQTALTHRVAKLEKELGVLLFNRASRNLALTPEGLMLLPRARRHIDDLQGALLDIKTQGRLRQSKITMGCVPSLAETLLPKILAEFTAMEPDIRVKIFDGYAAEIADRIQEEEIEFGLTIRRATLRDLEFTPIVEDQFVVLCPETHPLAGRRQVAVADLVDYPVIRNTVAADSLLNSEPIVNWTYEAENIATAVEFVRAGVGITIMPKLGLAPLRKAGLTTIDLVKPSIARTIGLLWKPGHIVNLRTRDFMSLIEERVRSAHAVAAASG